MVKHVTRLSLYRLRNGVCDSKPYAVFDGYYGEERETPYSLYLGEEGAEGWYSTPSAKVASSDKWGDGKHPVQAEQVFYESKTAVFHCVAVDRREPFNRAHNAWIPALSGVSQIVRARFEDSPYSDDKKKILDGSFDTFLDGYITVDIPESPVRRAFSEFEITLTANNPRRFAWTPQTAEMNATEKRGGSGLEYGEHAGGLKYPLAYGVLSWTHRAILKNEGTARSWPIFRVQGAFSDGVKLLFSDNVSQKNYWLQYPNPLSNYDVLVFDCGNERAFLNGADVTRNLEHRQFPCVESSARFGDNAHLTCELASNGAGKVVCEVRNAYL